ARRERAHRRIEVHERRVPAYLDPSSRARGLVGGVDLRTRAGRRRSPRDPAHLLDARDRRIELALAAHHDAVARGVERGDVDPLCAGDPEPAPLADGEVVDPAVAPEHATREIDDL